MQEDRISRVLCINTHSAYFLFIYPKNAVWIELGGKIRSWLTNERNIITWSVRETVDTQIWWKKEKNLTQKDLAEKLYVSDKTVSKWERGVSQTKRY